MKALSTILFVATILIVSPGKLFEQPVNQRPVLATMSRADRRYLDRLKKSGKKFWK